MKISLIDFWTCGVPQYSTVQYSSCTVYSIVQYSVTDCHTWHVWTEYSHRWTDQRWGKCLVMDHLGDNSPSLRSLQVRYNFFTDRMTVSPLVLSQSMRLSQVSITSSLMTSPRYLNRNMSSKHTISKKVFWIKNVLFSGWIFIVLLQWRWKCQKWTKSHTELRGHKMLRNC